MPIPVQCPECHKRYQAPDHMAGRRVKCKYCAVVFLIAADSRTESPDFDLAQLDELSALAETGRHDAMKRGGTVAGAAALGTPAGGAPAARPAPAEDDPFQVDFFEAGARRTNKLYVFPMSRLLDRWLAPVLLAIGIIWACREAWSRNQTGRAWVGAFRAAVFLLAYFAAVYPFTLMGVRAAARRLRYELPPRVNLRVLGTYAVPAALAAALWLIYQDVTGLLLGCLIGVAVALPVLFLLLRLLPAEAPVTFAYAAGSFLLSVVVSTAALFAFNLMLVGILRSLKTEHTMTVSPFGPGFRWDGPARAKAVQLARADGVPDEAEPASPTTAEAGPGSTGATRPAADTEPNARTRISAPATRESDGTGPEMAGGTRPGPSVPTLPRDATGRGPAPLAPDPPGTTAGPAGDVPSFIPDGSVGGARAQSGVVKSVRTVLQGDNVTALVRPVTAGPWLAVVRPGPRGTDRVERWNTETWRPAGEAQLARDPDGNVYALSPDGDLLAYLTDFPSLSIQVWSFDAGRVVREIRLKTNPRDDWGEPRVLGFSRPDQLVVQWRRDNKSGIEVHAARGGGGAPRHFAVEDFDASPGTFAISPDGQSVSVLWRGTDSGGIASYALSTSKLLRTFPINVLDWARPVRPAALAYTPDGTQIAAVIEGNGQGLFAAWPSTGRPARPTFKHVVPVGDAGDGTSGFEGQAFSWLDAGKAYVLYGASVLETETGRFLGEIGAEGVRSQSARAGDQCEIARANDAGHVQIDLVTFDLAKARDAGAEAGARPSTRKPATRRAAAAATGTDPTGGTGK